MRSESDRQISGILFCRLFIHQEPVCAHALRVGKFRRSPRHFQIDEPGIPNVFYTRALRRVIKKLAERRVLTARPSRTLAEINVLVDRLKIRNFGLGVSD